MKNRFLERSGRDWSLILIVLLIGVCLMLVAGERATMVVANWSLNADMDSMLDPYTKIHMSPQTNSMQPVSPEILNEPAWLETYLTPMAEDNDAEKAFAIVVFDPNVTPSATPSPAPTATEITPEPSPTITETPSPSPTPVVITTKKKKDDDDDDPPPPPPVSGCTDPAATNYNPAAVVDDGSCTVPPPVESTPEGSLIIVPAGINVGPPDGGIGNVGRGQYTVVDVTNGGVDPAIKVEGPWETNYDLVYYEWVNGTEVSIDHVILGISQDVTKVGNPYYEVFNWGNNIPDINTSLDTNKLTLFDPAGNPVPAPTERDDQVVPPENLYPNPPITTNTDSGVLIDVDNAPSHPPPGDYEYVVIITLASKPNHGGANVDAIEVVEVTPP